jgi:ethanolaminephosphotransferase
MPTSLDLNLHKSKNSCPARRSLIHSCAGSLIRNGNAIPFTANARSPTVTMPRLKAITTGSIPSFVDLILNFDEADTSSTLAVQDTWLAQLKAKQLGKLLMYGDDTWLKLFPETFDRYDGTTSFFVSDFTEVDHNVTRNVAGELKNDDWGLMVLHYLGLDHIGHKSGPRSPHMVPKQHEMDDIVKVIYKAMESKEHLESTLFVLCGDHGMNDAGNHGASSPGETSPALVFISPKLRDISKGYAAPAETKEDFDYYSKIEQSDIAPTIAALLGFPVSKNNLGAFIPEFLPFWPKASDQIQVLLRNAMQILDIVTASFGHDLFDANGRSDPCAFEKTDINELACEWRKISQRANALATADEVDQDWLTATSSWLRKAQDLMSSMASNYDMPKLIVGQALILIATITSVSVACMRGSPGQGSAAPLLLIALLYGIMMFASSYVEEEHHFWYWSSTLWVAWLGTRYIYRLKKPSALVHLVMALASIRLMRSWNQTGQKFAGESDIVKRFVAPFPDQLWILVCAMYMMVAFQIFLSSGGIPFENTIFVLVVTLVASALKFKLAFTAEDAPELVSGFAEVLKGVSRELTLLTRARIVFALLVALVGFSIYVSVTGKGRANWASNQLLHHLITLFAITQSRATNIPIFILCTILQRWFQDLSLSTAEISTTSILLQYASFFAFGGSNAISSVDLSSAYNGVSGFNVFAVGLLTFASNWAGPLYWASATNLLLLQRYRQGDKAAFWRHACLLTTFATTSVAFVMAACTALRTHLFIWTVFSPKYLYCMAWGMAQHLLVNIGLGSVLFWLGAR